MSVIDSPKPERKRRLFLKGLILGAVLTVTVEIVVLGSLYLYWRPHFAKGIAERMRPPAIPSRNADFAWELQTADGDPFALESLRGEVIVLSLWKPACHPCKAQLPTIQMLADLLYGEDVAVLPVAVENDDAIADEVETLGLRLPYYIYEGKIPDAYHVRTTPTTFVIDRQGRIVMEHEGTAQWDDPGVVSYIRGLIALESVS